ncbi:DUF808 domain-containing protein [Pelagerythrobacter aerophilus]|uniref:DUF808 domain-containing protein n=1 Tax=Pelagerythrobacter aerophilus TaxID=2306995 RepID=A0A418NM64_9SPHN|nr:DUF808 domain-containing protein [Pelagerythrobacter aerophilus]RIV81448.1 DUF808 domain-containing protein [Pelagerythrobacter aerophilus]
MPGGLVALLDDVSVIARAAAGSVDDVSIAASRAGSKAAGVVIDDAAVTPSYVTGLSPARELPIIWKITKGSLKNKLLILLPGALLLSQFLPAAIIFILMLGGGFLSYEGAEKVMEKLGGEKHGKTLEDPIEDPAAFEQQRVSGAIRTDLILSAEIMAITLNEVAVETFVVRAGVLALVGVAITFVVYGAVALIVKMDDVGLHLSEKSSALAQSVGRFLLRAMPRLLTALSLIGTVAMLWVGGGIVLHGLAELGVSQPEHLVEDIRHGVEAATGAVGGVAGWITFAGLSALFGLVLGAVIAFVLHKVLRIGSGAH